MRVTTCLLIVTGGIVLAASAMAAAAAGPCASGNCTVTPPSAWAQLRPGLGTSVPVAYPRATQGAVLRTVTLATPPELPYDPEVDQGEPIITCAAPDITASYRTPAGGSVRLEIGASENTSPGCGAGTAVGYRCASGHLQGVTGVVLACRGPRGRRALSWSGPSWGYWLEAPAGFPITTMALSTR